MTPFDAIVIGGGPAGTAAAITLSRQGKNILLFEKQAAPHHKVCGEFISADAARSLAALGIDLSTQGAEKIHTARLFHGNKAVEAALPFPAFSLSRFSLDECLMQLAEKSHVTVRRNTVVTSLFQAPSGWAVKADQIYSAPTVFLATGKHNLRAWPRPPGAQNDMIGFKMHFRLHPRQFDGLRNSVEMFLFDGGYAGLEPVENDLANFCMVAHKTLYNACDNNWPSLLDKLFRTLPPLARRLEQSEACRDRPLSIFGIPYGYIYQGDGPPGLYRLGDQMAVIPSFCGNGIAIALHTARLASAHAMGLNNQADYYRQARAEIGQQVRSATALMQWGSNPLIQKTFHTACRVYPDLLTMTAARMARRRSVRGAV